MRISQLDRLSEIEEILRYLKSCYEDLNDTRLQFLDRQNELLIVNDKGQRYNAYDLKLALGIVSTSRSSYLSLRRILTLPSIRTIQRTVVSAKNVDLSCIVGKLSGFQKHIQLNIDEIYIKPSLRFSGGQIFGYSADCPEKLEKTILVVLAISDFGGPQFVAVLRPVCRLTAEFQADVIKNVIEEIEQSGGQLVSCTFDGNAINSKCSSFYQQ